MVLLTSSQVSVAISSFIIVSFTLALFLSGYVLQQATVRDLRAAIKPQMVQHVSEQVNLSPQLRGELGGVIDTNQIDVDNFRDDNRASLQAHKDVTNVMENESEEEEERNDDDMIGATRWQKEKKKKKEKLLADQRNAQKPIIEGKSPLDAVESSPTEKDAKEKAQSDAKERQLSRAERRKKIKAEAVAAGQGETITGYRRRMW